MNASEATFKEVPALFGPDVLDERAAVPEPAVLQLALTDDGRISVRGPRAAVVELLACCARHGLVIQLDYLNWCG